MNYRSPIGIALVKVAAKSREKLYAPDVLAHELGHSRLHGQSGALMSLRNVAPAVGSVSNIVTNTPYGLAGHLVPLADEAHASSRALKTMGDWDIDEEDRRAAKKRLGLGFASYAVGPAVDAGMTVGGIAAGSRAMTVAAPFAAGLAGRSLGPRLARRMDNIPIKGIPAGEVRRLSRKARPGVDVHLARKRMPGRGGFVNKPLLAPSEVDIGANPLHDEFGAFIGRKASGKLLRKGGVVLGPIN